MHKTLSWEQRIALARNNLHAASRSGDFTFFKSLQAQGFVEGTNHVATLSATMGDEADAVLAALDDFNATIAYMHQEAFSNVYNSLKTYYADDKSTEQIVGRSKVFVDATMQKQMADHSIDKMTRSAIDLIREQDDSVQEAATNVWIMGNTIIADCMDVTLKQIDSLEHKMSDFIRIEDSYETVKASVSLSVATLKAVFNLMADDDSSSPTNSRPTSGSFNFTGGNMLRRLSSAFVSTPSAPSVSSSRQGSVASTVTRRESIAPEYKTPNYLRNSVSSSVPTSLPPPVDPFSMTRLDTIPPTPAADIFEENINPFDMSMSVPPVPQIPASERRVPQAVMVLM